MAPFFQKILQFLTSRLSRNLVVWAVVAYSTLLGNIPEHTEYVGAIYLGKIITVLSLVLFTYANNLWLVPKYLAQKKRAVYFVAASLLVLVYSVLFTLHVKLFINAYPIKYYQVVFMSVPFNKSWALRDLINQATSYAFIYALWLLVFTMAWFMNDYSRHRQIAADAQKKQVEAELDFLKSQINPHFLFNTLNNLYGLALGRSGDTAPSILKLSSILRYLLYESNRPAISFEKEKEIMQAYIDLELLRLHDTGNLNFTIQADKPYDIPPLLWMPVLENVFKHGTRTISEKHMVDYRFVLEQGKLQIYSKNNCGLTAGKDREEKGGIGLSNLGKRLALLYPNKHKIAIEQNDRYYTIQVDIDLN